VAELVDLQNLAGSPDQRDGTGQQTGVDRLADGGLVAVEFHRRQRTQPCSQSPAVSLEAGWIAGAKLPAVSTSFNDPSREAEKEVRVTSWARQAPTGN
jgi:hypothetical protein